MSNSYQIRNTTIWNKMIDGLNNCDAMWLSNIIDLHKRAYDHKFIYKISDNCKIEVSGGVVYIDKNTFNCNRTTVRRAINRLINKNKLVFILSSKSKTHGGILVYIPNHRDLINVNATNLSIETIDKYSKLSLSEGEYSTGIVWDNTSHYDTKDNINLNDDKKYHEASTHHDIKDHDASTPHNVVKSEEAKPSLSTLKSITYEAKKYDKKSSVLIYNYNNTNLNDYKSTHKNIQKSTCYDMMVSKLSEISYELSEEYKYKKEVG